LAIISKTEFVKIERFLRKILEALHMKLLVYKIIIIPTQVIAIHRLRKIMNKSNISIKKDKKGKKILFISLDARHTPHTYFEGGIAKFLQIRGHEVKMVICNKTLSMCTTHFTIRKPFNPWVCKNCANFSKKFYEITKLPYTCYNEYITQNDIESIKNSVNKISAEECENYIYKGVTVGYHAVTSAQRYFLGDKPSRSTYEPILRTELINAMISTDVAEKVYNKEHPDILISSHGCYSSWGSFTDYFMNRDVSIYVWGIGETHTIRFAYPKSDFNKYFNDVRQKKLLNEDEEKELDNFFNLRSRGTEGQVVYYGFKETTEEELKKKYAFQNFEKTYVMFPNVPWDSAAFATGEKIAFKDIYDWFLYNAELFKNKPNYQLIIKIHPSEVKVMESKTTIAEFIADKCYPLTENIKIIPPDTKISPYSLFPFIDVGLVYTGTIGLEMSMNGIPVITGGSAHYANKGFTNDTKTKEEYAKLLYKDISISPDQQRLAKLYAYFYFIKSFLPNSFMISNNFMDISWNMHSLDEVKPGKNKYVDHICDYIIKGKVYQNW
jgi:hypothetical protein